MERRIKKVTFFSNYLSHHQIPFSDAMKSIPGIDYKFVATMPFNQKRATLGYRDLNYNYSYVIRAYDDTKSRDEAYELANSSDLAIIGSASDNYVIRRLKNEQLTFKYSERLYKNDIPIVKYPHAAVSAWLHHGRFQNRPLYMLCASAYTAADCAYFGNYKNKTFKWGYFPEECCIEEDKLFRNKGTTDKVLILWVGRLIDWKHPELSIIIADRLKNLGYNFELNIIGNGELENTIREMISALNLSDCVKMLGSMQPEKVQEHMQRAHIFLFTSDFNEGWGAVLNEAMSNGCSVVASHAIGSVPFLIKHEENGLIYCNGNIDDLFNCVKHLMNDKEFRLQLGKKAFHTIHEIWNARIASLRLIELAENLLNGGNRIPVFDDGPCSPAPILSNDWFKY